MKICIIGWYGTETIGDRAILAGLLCLFGEAYDQLNISIGSLYTNLTERTILEDYTFYKEISNNKISDISIFDSLDPKSLKEQIKNSDLLIIGGGPLMDIEPMYMLEYAFQYAKRKGVKTAVLGCGWGPLNNPKYLTVATSIIKESDLTIFRDSASLNQFKLYNPQLNNRHILSSIDPAFFCAFYYKNKHSKREGEYIAVNFRDISLDQYDGSEEENEKTFKLILKNLSEYSLPIHLIPMHTFYVGGDDRHLLNRLFFETKDANIIVHNNPLSLVEVMDLYMNAKICVGMRFHSIVLQTILNGKNIILDYTNPKTGKIISMMKELQMEEVYKNCYYSLQNNDGNISWNSHNDFQVDKKYMENTKKIYIDSIKELLDNG